jgi:hypothetical protein
LPKPTAINTCNYLITRATGRNVLVSLSLQFLDPSHFVTGCAVIACDFSLDYGNRAYLIRDTEVRGLPKTGNPFRPPGLSVRYPGMAQTLFNGVFHNFPYQLRNGIAVPGKRTTQIALVK